MHHEPTITQYILLGVGITIWVLVFFGGVIKERKA